MNLTEGDIKKQLINMAIPAGTGLFFYTLYNIVDTFYAGLISTEAVAGLAISFPLYFILLAFAVAACATYRPLPQNEVEALVDACLEETQAPGSYSVFPGGASTSPEGALPRASGIEALGGTRAGADAVNDCIKRRALGTA